MVKISVSDLFVHVVLVPDLFQMLEGIRNVLMPLLTDRHDECVDQTQRRDQRIHKGNHIALGGQGNVCLGRNGRKLTVRDGNDGGTSVSGIVHRLDRTAGVAREADTDDYIVLVHTQDLLKYLADGVGAYLTDIVKNKVKEKYGIELEEEFELLK